MRCDSCVSHICTLFRFSYFFHEFVFCSFSFPSPLFPAPEFRFIRLPFHFSIFISTSLSPPSFRLFASLSSSRMRYFSVHFPIHSFIFLAFRFSVLFSCFRFPSAPSHSLRSACSSCPSACSLPSAFLFFAFSFGLSFLELLFLPALPLLSFFSSSLHSSPFHLPLFPPLLPSSVACSIL